MTRIESQQISTLQQFYRIMHHTTGIRRMITRRYLDAQTTSSEHVDSLRAALDALRAMPASGSGRVLELGSGKTITIDPDYEITELEKDLVFLCDGEDAFDEYLRERIPLLHDQAAHFLSVLEHLRFRNFITDRDGTVNNYCGRYLSSVQSVYNAVFLTRFARRCARNAVILTSAPLKNGGLLDISTAPDGIFINAGSKGREFCDAAGQHGALEIGTAQQDKLEKLNSRIAALLAQPEYEIFSLIGSGFQQKFGQTTVARQDITRFITSETSTAFLEIIRETVRELDPGGEFFRIEDTGLDIEIILTIDGQNGASNKDFDKGDGVEFLDDRLSLRIADGANLVCGDTPSDIPLLSCCHRRCERKTWVIFVTTDARLMQSVKDISRQSFFVDSPDILVYGLHELSKR